MHFATYDANYFGTIVRSPHKQSTVCKKAHLYAPLPYSNLTPCLEYDPSLLRRSTWSMRSMCQETANGENNDDYADNQLYIPCLPSSQNSPTTTTRICHFWRMLHIEITLHIATDRVHNIHPHMCEHMLQCKRAQYLAQKVEARLVHVSFEQSYTA